MMTKKLIYLFLFLPFILSSCKEENEDVKRLNLNANGIFVTNEGTFGKGNGSISFLDLETDSMYNDIFLDINKRSIGDVVQSAFIKDPLIYIVVNASNKIEIAEKSSFKSQGMISGLEGPRYMTILNDKAFVSQWGEGGKVKVVDVTTKTVVNTIVVGKGPEDIRLIGGKIWVVNGGGYDVDSTVSIIDPLTETVIKTVKVGDNPKKITLDKDGNVWVLCSGNIVYASDYSIESETPSKLAKISPTTFEKTSEIILFATKHPQCLDINVGKDSLFYGGGFGFTGVYVQPINSTSVATSAFIDGSKFFYGFNINPKSGEIYATEAPDFSSNGFLYRYSSKGDFIKKYSVGVGPSGAVFK